MRRAVCLCLAFCVSAPALATVVVDASQTKVKLVDHPTRIVTLMPSLAELAADFVGPHLERIVGVSEYTDYPPKLEKTTSIGPYSHFNLEKVVALKPDLVLASTGGNSRDQILHLRELGIPVVVVTTDTFEEIEASMRLVGEAMGHPKDGIRMADRFKKELISIRAQGAKRKGPRPRVLLQVGDEPLIAAGKKTFLHQALEVVGAENVYGDSDAQYPRPATEDVLHRNPDLILVLALGKDLRVFNDMAAKWKQFPKLKAVQEGHVRVLQGDPILRPSLRLLEGLSLLRKAVQVSS